MPIFLTYQTTKPTVMQLGQEGRTRNHFILYYTGHIGKFELYRGTSSIPIQFEKIPGLADLCQDSHSFDFHKNEIELLLKQYKSSNKIKQNHVDTYQNIEMAQLALETTTRNLRNFETKREKLLTKRTLLQNKVLDSPPIKKSWKYIIGIGLSLVLCATGVLSIIGLAGLILSISLLISSMMCSIGFASTIAFSIKCKNIISKNQEIIHSVNRLRERIIEIDSKLSKINSRIQNYKDKIDALTLQLTKLKEKEQKIREDKKSPYFPFQVINHAYSIIKSKFQVTPQQQPPEKKQNDKEGSKTSPSMAYEIKPKYFKNYF